MTATTDLFAKIFNEVPETIAFDPEWKNGTGYLDGIANDFIQPSGLMAKTVDDRGRRVLIIGTPVGSCAIFERFSPKEDGTRSDVLVCNVPSAISRLLGLSGAINETSLNQLTGGYSWSYQNIGLGLLGLRQDLAKHEAVLDAKQVHLVS